MDFSKAFKMGFPEETRHEMWKYIVTPMSEEEREKFRSELLQKGFRLPTPEFNEKNLRFEQKYLNDIGTVVCLFPLEFMADYVSEICKKSMDNNDGLIEQVILGDEITDEFLAQKVDATILGSWAYIVLHTKDDMIKSQCLDTLWRFLNYYCDNLMKIYMEQLKNNPVN